MKKRFKEHWKSINGAVRALMREREYCPDSDCRQSLSVYNVALLLAGVTVDEDSIDRMVWLSKDNYSRPHGDVIDMIHSFNCMDRGLF